VLLLGSLRTLPPSYALSTSTPSQLLTHPELHVRFNFDLSAFNVNRYLIEVNDATNTRFNLLNHISFR